MWLAVKELSHCVDLAAASAQVNKFCFHRAILGIKLPHFVHCLLSVLLSPSLSTWQTHQPTNHLSPPLLEIYEAIYGSKRLLCKNLTTTLYIWLNATQLNSMGILTHSPRHVIPWWTLRRKCPLIKFWLTHIFEKDSSTVECSVTTKHWPLRTSSRDSLVNIEMKIPLDKIQTHASFLHKYIKILHIVLL
jgi:hypothetical protein